MTGIMSIQSEQRRETWLFGGVEPHPGKLLKVIETLHKVPEDCLSLVSIRDGEFQAEEKTWIKTRKTQRILGDIKEFGLAEV